MKRKTAQGIEMKEVKQTSPPLVLKKVVRITKVRDAQRLLSRLINEFQHGTVEGRWAKDLCYLISVYVQVARDTDLEARLAKLEEGHFDS